MANEHYKEFLNERILGSNAGTFRERTFERLGTGNIGQPVYNAKFFETFPTVWACAYAFQRSLEQNDQSAIEEWLSLFLLHFFGVLHLTPYSQQTIAKGYDRDLWPALSGTYPRQDDLTEIRLLTTDDESVAGAYFPDIAFFPSRGRTSWTSSENLKPYLRGTRLSWAQCRDAFLQNANERKEFYSHLRSVSEYVLHGKMLKDSLSKFLDEDALFTEEQRNLDLRSARLIDRDPLKWQLFGGGNLNCAILLEKYPLRQNRNGGTTYYLVEGMPQAPGSEWMRAAIAPGFPQPSQYQKGSQPDTIVVRFAGQEISCKLVEPDKVVLLKELFLSDQPYLCGVPKSPGPLTSKIRQLHKLDISDGRGIFSALKENEAAMCLAPITAKFLRHFPEVLNSPDNKASAYRTPASDGIHWSFTILNKSVTWPTNPSHSKALPNSALALWPPKVAKEWHIYLGHGTGAKKEECGRWLLVDEKGREATTLELADDEYISLLHNPDDQSRPIAMLLKDNAGKERGVMFLADFGMDVDAHSKASLSVDFGTSNTCIAYKLEGEEVNTQVFGLSPVMLWGPAPELENPGFIPFQWTRGQFYPTILLSRRSAEDLEKLRPEAVELKDILRVDIPGFHKEMEVRLYGGELDPLWRIHSNLKWELKRKTPWRSLFLGLSLLYAHAEVFFRDRGGALIGDYRFTFPLALPDDEQDSFHNSVKDVIGKIRNACYGSKAAAIHSIYKDDIDESTAIAESVKLKGTQAVMEVFIDVGGGTADIAVRNENKFLVLDSIKVAGKAFFRFAQSNFVKKELEGGPAFRRHLGSLLLDREEELPLHRYKVDLGTFYSLAINALNEDIFTERELAIRKEGMGSPSYQRYRTQVFFRHIVAYGLLQACAAAVDNKLTPKQGIKIIFGGNAWGLMMFAEFERSKGTLKAEAEEILQGLQKVLLENVQEDEKQYIEKLRIADIVLLNEEALSKAKTSVAEGALKAAGGNPEKWKPYTGITLRGVKIDEDLEPVTIRWCDRWGAETLKKKFGDVPIGEIHRFSFEEPDDFEKPFDPLLAVFTRLANSRRRDQDQMPPEQWATINGLLCQGDAYITNDKPGQSPINYFMSTVLYPEDEEHVFLNELAKVNKTY